MFRQRRPASWNPDFTSAPAPRESIMKVRIAIVTLILIAGSSFGATWYVVVDEPVRYDPWRYLTKTAK